MHPFLNITKLIEKYWLLPTEFNFRASKTKNTNWKIKNYIRKKLKKVGVLLSGPPIWVVLLAQKVDVNMTFWGVPWVGHNDTLPLPLERSLTLFLVSAPLKEPLDRLWMIFFSYFFHDFDHVANAFLFPLFSLFFLRSCFILLFLQKDCSTIRRSEILQGLPVAARRIFKDSLTF